MTQTAPPTTDGAQTQQFMLFDLGETIAPPAPAEPPPQPEATPTSAARSNKRSQRPAAKASTQPTPVRLEIAPASPLPELLPLQLAAVRTALCHALAAQTLATYQALLAGQIDDQTRPSIGIPPERIAAAARLLSESPALNAAVSLLALGTLE